MTTNHTTSPTPGTVTLQQLRDATTAMLDHLESYGHTRFELETDYYWSIPREQRCNMHRDPEPKELTIGQLYDDAAHVRKVAAGRDEPMAYSLVWLSTVLREIGETTAG